MLRSTVQIQDNSGVLVLRVITSFNNKKNKPFFFPKLIVWGTIFKYRKYKEHERKAQRSVLKGNQKKYKRQFAIITTTRKSFLRTNGVVCKHKATKGLLLTQKDGELRSRRVWGTMAKEILLVDYTKFKFLKNRLV